MTLAAERKRAGRTPLTIVEMDLDTCSLTYGVAPCTASGAAGTECYNTRKTCQDAANYTRAAKTYRFCTNIANLPIGLDAFPCLESVSTAPTRIVPGQGLGYRASVTMRFQDFPHHDRGIDPYVATRPYNPMQGTFFGKLLARTPYYQGRTVRVMTGYLDANGAYDPANFQTEAFVLESFSRPDAKGKVTVKAKDVLSLTDAAKAQVPVASTGSLSADITATDTSLTLQAGEGADYNDPAVTGANEYVRIGSEIIQYTGISTDTLTGLTRGAWGTTADTHAAGNAVQQCKAFEAVNVVDAIQDLILNYTNIPASYIDTAAWNAEKAGQLSGFNITGILSKPEGVGKVIGELTDQSLCYVYWNERAQKIVLKAFQPYTTDTALDDSTHFMDLKVDDDPKQRLSRIIVYYGLNDHANPDKPESYANIHVQADLDAEGTDKYDEAKIKVVKSRWYQAAGPIIAFASRTLKWLNENPRIASFTLDAKDGALWTGDPIDITSDRLQGPDGAPLASEFFILEAQRAKGETFKYKAMNNPFFGRYAKVMADGTADFAGENAGGWISDATGKMGDGSDAFMIQ